MQPDPAAMAACIEACTRCHAICLSEAATHCLEAGGAHVEPAHFRLMMDCAQICGTAADFMLRQSAHHARLCAICVDICDACAESYAAMDGMERCTEACRHCARECRAMADAAA